MTGARIIQNNNNADYYYSNSRQEDHGKKVN